MRLRLVPVFLLAGALAGCHKEGPPCGDPAFPTLRVTYQVVDEATGHDWFAASGRTSPDSLRLLPSGSGPGQWAVRAGGRVLLGPVRSSPVGNQGVVTQLLRFSATDVDTLLIRFDFNAAQSDPCGYGPGVGGVEITYNGRSNAVFRAVVPTDSLDLYAYGYEGRRVVQLRKRR